jgi:hypothetical protein
LLLSDSLNLPWADHEALTLSEEHVDQIFFIIVECSYWEINGAIIQFSLNSLTNNLLLQKVPGYVVHAQRLCMENIDEDEVVIQKCCFNHWIRQSTYWSCCRVQTNFRVDVQDC